jgi:hypothetical protein
MKTTQRSRKTNANGLILPEWNLSEWDKIVFKIQDEFIASFQSHFKPPVWPFTWDQAEPAVSEFKRKYGKRLLKRGNLHLVESYGEVEIADYLDILFQYHYVHPNEHIPIKVIKAAKKYVETLYAKKLK